MNEIDELLDELTNLDAVTVYFDRRWEQNRESSRIDTGDEVYVRLTDLQEVIVKWRERSATGQ